MWRFPEVGVPQIGSFVMENPIKMDDLGIPPIYGEPHVSIAHKLFFVPWIHYDKP